MIVILLDLDSETSMKAVSSNTFVIGLPTKGTFELRITNPSDAFILAISLMHLLSLVIESRDTQWLLSKLTKLDAQLGKWQWYEAVQTAKLSLQSAKLQAATSLLHQSNRQKDMILKSVIRWTRSIVLEGDLFSSQTSIEKALNEILTSVAQAPTLRSVVKLSNLRDALKKISESDKTKLSPRLFRSVAQMIQIVAPDAKHSTSYINDLPSKRRNIETSSTIDTVFKHLLITLGLTRNISQDHITQLKSVISEKWESFTDSQRCIISESVGLLGCASAGKLKLQSGHNSQEAFKCLICDGTEKLISSKQPPALNLRDPLYAIINQETAPSVKIAATRSFGRLVTHDSSPQVFIISESVLAERVVCQLKSNNRDVRIATTKTIPLLFKDRESQTLTDAIMDNRNLICRLLRNLLPTNEKPLLETTVMAFSEIGKVATQNELSFVLSTLVDFLGHNNSFIAALAYREIFAVASAHGQSTWQMFSPFWHTISIKVVEQMRSRPQILQRLSEILDIRDSMFLMRTQNFTVPPLVLGKHRDVLALLSQKMGVRAWEMLKENMPYILAGIFTQDNRRAGTGTGTEFLVELMAVSTDAKLNVDTRGLVVSCRTPLTVELLKMLANETEGKRERVFNALQTVALYVSEKPVQLDGGTKSHDFLKSYLLNNILELMNHFTDIITDKRGRKTFTEKIGCIAGIQEIITFAAGASKAAVPQVFPRRSRLS
jgi:hypothetical protein